MRSQLNTNPENDKLWIRKAVLFLASQNLSLFGSMLVQYAIIWYITLETRSGAVLTISTVMSFFPQIVISLFAGVWADRFPRKRLIILSDLLTAASTLFLAIAFLMGYRDLWLIYLVSAIRSVGAGIQMPAVNALLPQIVPAERLLKVNSFNGTIQPFIMLAAPLLSGGLLSLARLEYIFFIDVTTAILAVTLLMILHVPHHTKALAENPSKPLDDLKAGFRYIRQNATVKTLFLFYAFVFFLVTPVAFLTPLLVTRSFGAEVWRLTANEVTFFAGSILGGIIMTAWGGYKNHFRTIGLASIIGGVFFVGLGLSQDFIFYLGFMVLSGLTMPMWQVPTTTLLQETVETDMQGRVFGVNQLIMNTIFPVGMLFFGPLADLVSIRLILVISSALMILPGIWLFFSCYPLGTMPRRDEGILHYFKRWREPCENR